MNVTTILAIVLPVGAGLTIWLLARSLSKAKQKNADNEREIANLKILVDKYETFFDKYKGVVNAVSEAKKKPKPHKVKPAPVGDVGSRLDRLNGLQEC